MSIKKVFFSFLLIVQTLFAQDTVSGEEIFESKGCTMCHDESMEKMGPSLQHISIIYSGDEDSMVEYLKGQQESRVKPQSASTMRPQLLKIKTLYEDEIRALARYIIEIN